MNWDSIEWHDGTLQRLAVDFLADSVCELHVSLPRSSTSSERVDYRFKMHGLARLNSNFDVLALLQHRAFGNITDGKIFPDPPSRLILILAEGYLEVIGTHLECQENGVISVRSVL